MVSLPLLTIATIALLIAEDLTGSSAFLLGAYGTLAVLAIVGAVLLSGALSGDVEPLDRAGPSTDDIERVMTHNIAPPVTAKSVIEPIPVPEPQPEPTPAASAPAPVPATAPVEPTEATVVSSPSTDLFLSLSRRNKQLNRQTLSLISHLERDELDPETLQGLYELDHLATRIRRNEDILLFLASSRKTRQWSPPVRLEDVLRSSLAEVEKFSRVELEHVPDVEILGEVAANLTHLLAELIDNATDFSHSSTLVSVSANTTLEGLEIEVLDTGHGIEDKKREALNERLSAPPGVDEAPARRVGLFVAAHLAKDLDIEVELTGERGVGTVATLSLPNDLLVEHPEDEESDEESPLDSIDLLDPVLQFAVGAELAEDEEDELASASQPTDEEVAEALGGFPSVSVEVPTASSMATAEAPASSFPSIPSLDEAGQPLPSRIPQANFESVWGVDPLPPMPPQESVQGDQEFDDAVARGVANDAASSIAAFSAGVSRGVADTREASGSVFDILPEGEDQ